MEWVHGKGGCGVDRTPLGSPWKSRDSEGEGKVVASVMVGELKRKDK